MKKLILLSSLAFTFSSQASCLNLEGKYIVEDTQTQCKITRSGDVLFAHGDFPAINIMAKPGENYGYFLNQLVANEMNSISIEQNGCESFQIQSEINPNKQYLIEQGSFPYFGSRSPIFVESIFNEFDFSQNMLITKYTVSSNGQAKVYKDLKYKSTFRLNKDEDLEIKASIRYGRGDKLHETVECTFKKL